MDNPPNWLRRLGAGAAVAFVATCASTATATTIVTEPFGPGWTPGTTWATSGSYTPEVATDNTQTPASAMRLTPGSPINRAGLLSYTIPQPTSGGLDIRFKFAEWGGVISTGSRTADGLAFFLRKGSETSNAAGFFGASLGYAPWPGGSVVGLAGGLLGVGFDQWGGYTQPAIDGTNCAGLGQVGPGSQDNTIGIRGPGNGTTGYCYLGRTTAGAVQFGGGTDSRDGRARSVRITVDPATQANPKITVYYGATASATPTQVLQVDAPAGLLAEPTFRFGFIGSTGVNTQNNEVWDLQVSSLVSLPAIEITTTSLPSGTVGAPYACTPVATSSGVAPVTFAVTAGSLPAGLTLNAATGEICGTPTQEGSRTFTISATDSRGPTASVATRQYSIAIADFGPPCAPVDLAARAGITAVALSWQPNPDPACAGVKRYEVQASNGETCTTTAPVVTCNIANAPSGAPIRFRVRALNDVGASPWSEYVEPPVRVQKATVTPDAIVVTVAASRAGEALVVGQHRVRGRWVTRCVGRATVPSPTAAKRVACVLTPVARRILCDKPLRLRMTVRLTTPGKPPEITRSVVRATKRNCGPPAVTG